MLSSKVYAVVNNHFFWGGGYHGGSPTAVRPSDPTLCGSCPLVTPY